MKLFPSSTASSSIYDMSFNTTLEDYGVQPVPSDKAVGWLQIGLIIWGINICIPAIMLGTLIGTNAKAIDALIAITAGSIILTIISIGTGIVGSRTKMATALSAEFSFGIRGHSILGVILAATTFGWFGVQLEVFGIGLQEAVTYITNDTLSLPIWPFTLLGGVLMTFTAVFGLKAIAKLSFLAVPLLMVLLISALFVGPQNMPLEEIQSHTPKEIMPLGMLISSIVGAMAVGAVIMPDITRYSKGQGHTVGGVVLGMLVGFPIVLILAAYLVVGSGDADFMHVLLSIFKGPWGIVAIAAILLATWTTNDNNLYSASLALNSIITGQPKWLLTLIGGAVGTILALIGIMQLFMEWLLILGIAIPPIGAILIIDFILSRKKKSYAFKDGKVSAFNLPSWIAWVIGVSIGLLSFFDVLSLTKTPALDAIIAASAIYCAIQAGRSLCRSM